MLTIGDLSRRTGTKVPTIRYYEKIDLLEEPERSDGGQRRYEGSAVERLTFIRHARDMGFGLDAIRALLDLTRYPDASCETADQLAIKQLELVNQHIARLEALKKELESMIGGCNHADVANCRILEVLNNHDECLGEHAKLDKCLDH
ncbi:MAG TPA: MerR family transcriptional regulator [Rhizobiales bacterium]|nr:MerR family transcriptional regulator [Hyphomicrobiales bacterium]